MKPKLIPLILVLTFLNTLFLAYGFISTQKTVKIAVVQMEELVYSYAGMKEATANYSQKLQEWEAQADTLESKMKRIVEAIRQDSLSGNYKELGSKQAKFNQYRTQYVNYQQQIRKVAEQEDENLTLGVLNQIRQHMKDYATEHGYEMIIANTQLENVAYVAESVDVTAALLEYANQRYEYGD